MLMLWVTQRAVSRFYAITLAIFLTLLLVDIHRAMNIGLTVISTTLLLHRTSLIIGLHPVIGLLEIDAIADVYKRQAMSSSV